MIVLYYTPILEVFGTEFWVNFQLNFLAKYDRLRSARGRVDIYSVLYSVQSTVLSSIKCY